MEKLTHEHLQPRIHLLLQNQVLLQLYLEHAPAETCNNSRMPALPKQTSLGDLLKRKVEETQKVAH